MTASDSRSTHSPPPDPAEVKEAFKRCFSISDPDQRSAALNRLEIDSPQIAAEVRLLLDSLRSCKKVEKVSAYVPMLDLSLASVPERLEDLSDQVASDDPANFSVLRSIESSIASIPHVVLKSSEQDETVVKVRSSEIDEAWNNRDGRYRLDGEIARGGMGAILKGRDTDLGRDLAVKVLLKEHRDNPETVKRFIEEAQIGGQLQHPGIAPVYELGQFYDERPFFTMKLIKGKTLAALLAERKSVDDDRARYLGIFEQVCQTMAYAHSRGVLHRDLKPSNLMVGAFGEVQVMDWGLAKVLAAGGVADERKQQSASPDQSVIETVQSRDVGNTYPNATNTDVKSATRMGTIMGTLAYMCPEQAAGEIELLDQRADVFSLGSILCEILTGQPVYRRDSQHAPLVLARNGQTDEALRRLDDCSAAAELVQLAKDCLEVDQNRRPRDAQAISERLTVHFESVERRLRESELQIAQAETKAKEERKRRRVVLALACSIVLVVLLGSGSWLWLQEKNAQLAQIKTDAQIAAEAELSDLAQRVQSELATAAAFANNSERLPNVQDLTTAMDALDKAERLLLDDRLDAQLSLRQQDLKSKAIRLLADAQLIDRLRTIWITDQQYLAEQDIPPSLSASASRPGQSVPSSETRASPVTGIPNPAALYEEAFRNWGYIPNETSNSELMDRMAAMPAMYRPSIIASLDRWRQLLDEDLSLTEWAECSWAHLNPIEMSSEGDDRFTVLEGDSILVGGDTPGHGYCLTFETSQARISALRLEALLHKSLPNGGPGRGTLGWFRLPGFRVDVAPRSNPNSAGRVEIVSGAADYASTTFPFQVNRWVIPTVRAERTHSAFYRLAKTLESPSGFRVIITIHNQEDPLWNDAVLGHFRFSSTGLEDREVNAISLDRSLARLDQDPWRRKLRAALSSPRIDDLLQLEPPGDPLSPQPTILLTSLASRILSIPGTDLESQYLSEADWQVEQRLRITAEHGTEYQQQEDGSVIAGGPEPPMEVSHFMLSDRLPWRDLATVILRIEFLKTSERKAASIGRESGGVSLKEISITQTKGDKEVDVLRGIFTDQPTSIPLSNLVDGDEETFLQLPVPTEPKTIFIILDSQRWDPDKPLEVKIVSGGMYNLRQHPRRIRISSAALPDHFRTSSEVAEELLSELATEQPSDPQVHLQLARYYGKSVPVRSDDALRHASIAGSLMRTSVVPSLAFLEVLKPRALVDNRPLRQVAATHLQNVQRRNPQDPRILRLRRDIEGFVIETLAEDRLDQAERLIDFALDSFSEPVDFIESLLKSMPRYLSARSEVRKLILESCDRFLQQPDVSPRWAVVYTTFATGFYHKGMIEEAVAFTEKAVKIAPDYATGYLNLGAIYHDLRKFDDSSTNFQKAIELAPWDANSHAIFAEMLFDRRNFERAAEEFRKTHELRPDWPAPHFDLGKALFEAGKTDEAFSSFERFCQHENYSSHAEAHFQVGKWLSQKKDHRNVRPSSGGESQPGDGQPDEAETEELRRREFALERGIQELAKAVELAPERSEYLKELGVAYYRGGQWKKAVKVLEDYCAGESGKNVVGDRWHFFLLAMAKWHLGEHNSAQDWYTKGAAWVRCFKSSDTECLRIRRETADLLGLDDSQQKEMAEAGMQPLLEDLDRAIEAAPDDPSRRRDRALFHWHLQKFEESIPDFTKVLELDPNDSNSIGLRADAYMRTGQLSLALADRDRIIDLQPRTHYRYFQRAVVHRKLGNYEKALADLERGFEIETSDDVSFFTRARARLIAGDIYRDDLDQPLKAFEQYEAALELEPNNPKYLARRDSIAQQIQDE